MTWHSSLPRRVAATAAAYRRTAPFRADAVGLVVRAVGQDCGVRANVCAGANDFLGGTRSGELLWRDTATVMLLGRDGHEAIPLSRVRGLELRTRRSRELETVGVLLGIVAGVAAIPLTLDQTTLGEVALALLPVYTIAGGAAGYFVGSKLSGKEVWESMALPPGHGAACNLSSRRSERSERVSGSTVAAVGPATNTGQ